MTISALRALLNEIDQQGGPEAARHNRLSLPDEGTEPMSTAPAHPQTPAVDVRLRSVGQPPAEQVSVGQLLKWGDEHADPAVQDQAARARATLAGLRQRYDTDRELTALTSEEQQLEQRLAELRARKTELAPAKTKKPKKTVDYPAADVRAWAAENGIECPRLGRVPKAIVDAWKQATGRAA
ncbi:histone-like nucleoid-structuring protein Lsr2 [Streptomyces monashensis]|uniref:Lsr2 family DNA-binding protein n=1 Tax=Streptomyces monashensis TaxID=1678012 RepID=UPI0034115B88